MMRACLIGLAVLALVCSAVEIKYLEGEDVVDLGTPDDGAAVTPLHRQPSFIALTLSLSMSMLMTSAVAPLLTNEAAYHGVGVDAVGYIFAAVWASASLSGIVQQRYLSRVGLHRALVLGMVMISVACTVWSALHWIKFVSFVMLALFLEVIMGFGKSAINLTTNTFINLSYPDNFTTVSFYVNNAAIGSTMIGPFIAAALKELAGFPLPYLVLGAFGLCSTAIVSRLFPRQRFVLPAPTARAFGSVPGGGAWTLPMLFISVAAIGMTDVVLAPKMAAVGANNMLSSTSFALINVGWCLGQWASARLIDNHHMVPTAGRLGAMLAIAALLLTSVAAKPWSVALGVVGLTAGLASANAAANAKLIGSSRAYGDRAVVLATSARVVISYLGDTFGSASAGILFKYGGSKGVAYTFMLIIALAACASEVVRVPGAVLAALPIAPSNREDLPPLPENDETTPLLQ